MKKHPTEGKIIRKGGIDVVRVKNKAREKKD